MPRGEPEQNIHERETSILSVYGAEKVSAAAIVLSQRDVSGSDEAGLYQSKTVRNVVAGTDCKYTIGKSAAFHENDLPVDI